MSAEPPLIAIFGAAVRPDGQPSAALARRIDGARVAALAQPDARIFCSGAAGRAGPAEATVMARRLLAAGLTADRLVLDQDSRDTLQSAVAVARYARAHGIGACIACSDAYHLPRIRLLLALLGLPSRPGPAVSGARQAGLAYWSYMSLREVAALPYDAAIVLARRREFRRG